MRRVLLAGMVLLVVVGRCISSGVERAWVHAVLTGALAGALSHVLLPRPRPRQLLRRGLAGAAQRLRRVQKYIRDHAPDGTVCE